MRTDLFDLPALEYLENEGVTLEDLLAETGFDLRYTALDSKIIFSSFLSSQESALLNAEISKNRLTPYQMTSVSRS